MHISIGKKDDLSTTSFNQVLDVNINKVTYMLNSISTILENKRMDDYIVVLYGFGGQPPELLTELENISGIEVVSFDKYLFGNFFMRLLSRLTDSYRFLAKVEKFSNLSEAFLNSIDGSMAGIFIVGRKYEEPFLKSYKKNYSHKINIDTFYKDSSCFSYVVDGGNRESESNIVEIISYGMDCFSELKEIPRIDSVSE